MGDLASPLPVPPSAMTAPDTTPGAFTNPQVQPFLLPPGNFMGDWISTAITENLAILTLGAAGVVGAGVMLASKGKSPAWAPWAAWGGLLGAAYLLVAQWQNGAALDAALANNSQVNPPVSP